MATMRYAHLSAGFMLTSIIGFFVSTYFIWRLSATWGVTFAIFFAVMFIASIISMTHAPYKEKEFQDELAVHNKMHPNAGKKKKR